MLHNGLTNDKLGYGRTRQHHSVYKIVVTHSVRLENCRRSYEFGFLGVAPDQVRGLFVLLIGPDS